MPGPPVIARTAWLEAPRQLVWREEALGEPGPGHHLVRALASAISPGTELAAWTGAPPLRPGPVYPRLIGYCHVAEVLASGAGTSRARPGDRVLSFTSHRSAAHLADADILATVPDSIGSAAASVAYLFHLGYDAVLKGAIRPGARVAVIGLGALGLAATLFATIAGGEVAAISDQPALRDMARAGGASWTGARAGIGAGPPWLNGRADVVITTSNSWADWEMALAAAAPRGLIAVLGFPGRGAGPPPANPLDPRHFYQKQLRIEAVGLAPEQPDTRGFLRFNERDNLAFILGAIEAGRLDPGPYVAHSAPAELLAAAYDELLDRAPGQLTTILTWPS
jgi:threonine dehydrogenase-like Zn-dependent dehydrogenase